MAALHNTQRDALSPEVIRLGVVPSALTYRVRQLEDALDVLLFDRSSRQARLTPAGHELLREGNRLLLELDAIANRVKRVATGWEPQLTLAVDSVISRITVLELCEAFFALASPTRLRIREEALSGTLEALTSGQADLAIGVALEPAANKSVQSRPLGSIHFVYAIAPHHPLASAPEPVPDALLMMALTLAARRGVAVDLVLPERSNHRLADMARQQALRELADAGARVWLVPAMVHAKAVLIDDDLALAGSANLDERSLFLNYELMVAFYSPAEVAHFSQWVDTLRRTAHAYQANAPGLTRQFGEGIIRWLAFQL